MNAHMIPGSGYYRYDTNINPHDTRLWGFGGWGFRPWGFGGWGFRPWGFGFPFGFGFGFPFFGGFPFFI